LSRQCSYIKPNGERCRGVAIRSSGLCAAHDPSTQAARRQGQRKGGRNAGGTEVQALKQLLEDLTDRVVEGTLESGRAAVAAQLVNTRIRLMEYARRAREQEELEERMAEIERRLEAANSRRRG
jgi:hypothetical protein